MTQFYRIKHKPTGYYYKPMSHKGANLSKTGKVYHKFDSFFSEKEVQIQANKDTRVYKETADLLPWYDVSYGWKTAMFRSPIGDWEKEFINN